MVGVDVLIMTAREMWGNSMVPEHGRVLPQQMPPPCHRLMMDMANQTRPGEYIGG